MRVDISFLPALAAAFLLAFARVGTMVMLLPGVGEQTMPSRVRLGIALVLTAIILPSGPSWCFSSRKSSSVRCWD